MKVRSRNCSSFTSHHLTPTSRKQFQRPTIWSSPPSWRALQRRPLRSQGTKQRTRVSPEKMKSDNFCITTLHWVLDNSILSLTRSRSRFFGSHRFVVLPLTMLSGTWSASPVEVYVHRACDPSLPEPNYALNLELAEYINTKKANTPREAAMTIVRLINHRNPHISILAISLLQTLVQQCGYAFHLQISTKEFLNELVRRFPERPPPFPGPIMSRILDLIHAWKESICRESRFKEDFGNIRDMHRLLSFKGTYVSPAFNAELEPHLSGYRFRESSRNGNYNPQDATAVRRPAAPHYILGPH